MVSSNDTILKHRKSVTENTDVAQGIQKLKNSFRCSVVGPFLWPAGGLELVIPDYLRDPSLSFDSFRQEPKNVRFSFY